MFKFQSDLAIGIAISLLLHVLILIIPLSKAVERGGYFGDTLNLRFIDKAEGQIGSDANRQGELTGVKERQEPEERQKLKPSLVSAHKNSKPILKQEEKKSTKKIQKRTVGSVAGTTRTAESSSKPVHAKLSGLGWNNKKASYFEMLVAWIDRHKRYPFAAERSGTEGEAFISLAINPSGEVVTCSLINGSGSQLLDSEALNMIKRASPMPKPPRGLDAANLKFIIPIQFSLKRR